MSTPSLFLFGDQTITSHHEFADILTKARSSKSLQSFHTAAIDALRVEISALCYTDRRRFPTSTFTTLFEFVETVAADYPSDAVLNGVLLCIWQLSSFLWHYEQNPAATLPGGDNTLLGLCTGLLPASAVAASHSTAQFLTIATATVRICFRLGIEARRRTEEIEITTGESWATIVSGAKLQDVEGRLRDFHKARSTPVNKLAYVSAHSEATATISGPPSTLRELFRSTEGLHGYKHAKLPIYCAYHAPHLRHIDVAWILGEDGEALSKYLLVSGSLRLLSTKTGQRYTATNLRELMEQVLVDILQEPVNLDETLAGYGSFLKDTEVTIHPCGPTNTTTYIRTALQTSGCRVEVVDEKPAVAADYDDNSIAIVGMSGRFPSSETLEEFWKVFSDGQDLHRPVPSDRFDVATHVDPTGAIPNTTLTPYGCFIDRPGLFDSRFFSMSPREAAQTDPQQRLALLTTYEALEMAGYVPNRTPSTDVRRIGSFFGQSSDDWREGNAGQEIGTYYITGGVRAFGPGRMNYFFKWEGPSYSVDTACSSSLAAIQLGITSIMAGECDTAVAGGMNLLTTSDLFAGLSRGGFLSKTGACKTFNNDADGYCRADAVGTVVLKRLSHAMADRDNVLAVIRATSTNHSAEAVSITHPHAPTQERLFKRVLAAAGVAPREVDYVEMHGTGTQAGDATEMKSVSNVLTIGQDRETPLYIGTVKGNIGHGEAGAGVASLVKAVMMLRKNEIPPHVDAGIMDKINKNFPPLESISVCIPTTALPFVPQAGARTRKILVNNFDAAGGNTSLLLEDPPALPIIGRDPRSTHVVTVSAKTPSAYRGNLSRLAALLDQTPSLSLGDLAYTTTARRIQYTYRSAFAVSSISQLRESLSKHLKDQVSPPRSEVPTAAFSFTGQGSHYLGIGRQLFEESRSFRRDIQHSDSITTQQTLPSFLGLVDGTATDLSDLSPVQIQLGIVAVEIALANLWRSWGVEPSVVIGHSLGEYAALCIAGVLSVADTLLLVGRRAGLMMERCTPGTHAMLAVALSGAELSAVSGGGEIACRNGPRDTVLSGTIAEIEAIEATLRMKGDVRMKRLPVPYAFHSSQIDDIVDEYTEVAKTVTFNTPRVPVASPLLGGVVREDGIITAEYLSRHARKAVDFVAALEATKISGLVNEKTIWIEIGPKPVTLGMVKAVFDDVKISLPSLTEKEENWKTLSKSLATAYMAGVSVNWQEFHKEYELAHRMVELPAYAFEENNHWIQYEGNWLITRNRQSTVEKSTAPDKVATFSTSTLHRIASQRVNGDEVEVVFESDPAEPRLNAAILGHLVNGAGLCPSSIYADMAFSAVTYINSLLKPGTEIDGMDVLNMEVSTPLMAKNDGTKQIIHITASKAALGNIVEVKYSSTQAGVTKAHATCIVEYGDGSRWSSSWKRTAYLIQARIDYLQQTGNPHTSRVARGMAYKLFASLVDYHPRYQGMEEVWFDSKALEATAKIRFQTTAEDGKFVISPYYIDSIAHLSGFVLNGTDATPDDSVYISHGWESMKILGKLSAEKVYQTYVRMQPTGGRGVMSGDVFVFDGTDTVALVAGLKFQRIKRTVLDSLLPPIGARGHSASVTHEVPRPLEPVRKAPAITRVAAKNSLIPEILGTIVSELGIDAKDMSDDSDFAELGVDSLLTLALLSKFRKLTSIELPTSLFQTYSTVGSLKKFLQQVSGELGGDVSDDSSDDGNSSIGSPPTSASSASTPPSVVSYHADDRVSIFRNTIAEELGVGIEEITPTVPLADLGLDSLSSLSVLSTLRQKTGKPLPSSFFHDNPTFGAIAAFLSPAPTLHHKLQHISNRSTTPPANPVLLQGSPSSAKAIFLLPDGSGSAASYIQLPVLRSGNTAVYAIDSPFLHSPTDFTCSLEDVIPSYIAAIRSIRPHGPYTLGGWSVGGTYAFECAATFLAAGEEVEKLFLIDAPCRNTIPPIPINEVDEIFAGVPEKTKAHFRGTVNALRQYKPRSLMREVDAIAVWAGDSVQGARRTGGVGDWVKGMRDDYGPGGWEKLGLRVQTKVVEGDHWSCMKAPKVREVGRALEEGL